MQIGLRRTHGFYLPTGIPRIDTSDPLARGLIACYLPSSGTLRNLVGSGADLTPVSNYNWRGVVPEGTAMIETAASQGATALIPPSFKLVASGTNSGVTCFWRGMAVGNQSVDNTALVGVRFAAASGTSPFASYILARGAGGSVDSDSFCALWNNGAGTFENVAFNFSWSANYNKMYSLGATFPFGLVGVLLYLNGAPVAVNGAGVFSPTYNSDATMQFQCVTGETTAIGNVLGTIGLIYNRILTAGEMRDLSFNPYRFLIFPDDDIWGTIVGVAAVPPPSVIGARKPSIFIIT